MKLHIFAKPITVNLRMNAVFHFTWKFSAILKRDVITKKGYCPNDPRYPSVER